LIYVVGHRGALGGREAVEIFELFGHGSSVSLVWRACIPTQDAIQANDVVVTAAGEVVVSNFQPNGSFLHAARAAVFGSPTGNIMVWSPGTGWRSLDGTEASLANGIAVATEPDRVFYTEMITGQLHRRALSDAAGAIAVEIGGHPDNLSWTRQGKLLVATHTGGSALLLCSLGWSPCRSAWKIYEVDPDTLATKLLLTHDGDQIGAVTTALAVGDNLYLGSSSDDRIGVAALN
jgi:sugar lactone lactonase YvrE